eukprot:717141_1
MSDNPYPHESNGTCLQLFDLFCIPDLDPFENDVSHDGVNINQICLCGQKVVSYPYTFDECISCCRVTENVIGYYRCISNKCTYRQVTQRSMMVCRTCYECENNIHINSQRTFLFCKLQSIVRKALKL